jgi:hypothetical protein
MGAGHLPWQFCGDMASSICSSSCEQWLTGLVWMLGPLLLSTPIPPCEQLLTVVVGGTVVARMFV